MVLKNYCACISDLITEFMYSYSFLQQMYVLAELKEYVDSKPTDAASVEKTIQFIQSLNYLFEKGFLTHEKITSADCPILLNMQSGYRFFSTWLEQLLEQGMYNDVYTCQY